MCLIITDPPLGELLTQRRSEELKKKTLVMDIELRRLLSITLAGEKVRKLYRELLK